MGSFMYIGKILEMNGQYWRVVQLRDLSGRTIPREEPLQPYKTYDFSIEPVFADVSEELE